MSFFWHVLDEDDYDEARLPFIASGEGVKLLPYLDTASPAIPTVGIGFNMRDDALQDPIIRSIFYPGGQQETVLGADETYVTQIRDTIAQSHASNEALRSSLDAIMEDRRQYWEDAIALDPNIEHPGILRTTFSYANFEEMEAVFTEQAPTYEGTGSEKNKLDFSDRTENALFLGREGNDVIRAGSGNDYLYGENGRGAETPVAGRARVLHQRWEIVRHRGLYRSPAKPPQSGTRRGETP